MTWGRKTKLYMIIKQYLLKVSKITLEWRSAERHFNVI